MKSPKFIFIDQGNQNIWLRSLQDEQNKLSRRKKTTLNTSDAEEFHIGIVTSVTNIETS